MDAEMFMEVGVDYLNQCEKAESGGEFKVDLNAKLKEPAGGLNYGQNMQMQADRIVNRNFMNSYSLGNER